MTAGTTLITGAAGFAGRHLRARLRDQPIVAWHHPAAPALDAGTDRTVWRAVDLLDRAGVAAAIDRDRPSRIFHLAGAPQVDASWRSVVPHLRTNAYGTHVLLDAVRRTVPACRVLVVTSAQVYQVHDEPLDEDAPLIPATPYGLSKLAQDRLAADAARGDGLDVVLARPFNHTGPGQAPAFAVPSFARQVARIEAGLEPPVMAVGNLDTRRDLTDVRDVVDAYDLLMARAPAGRPYNICSGRAWRIGDLLDELLHLSTATIDVRVDEARLRPNDVPVIQGDATRIRSELGWQPHHTVEQTLRDTLEWWRRQTSA
ncbi:MAG TPA: GDP-mannose 4,6-dehydratase [Vicinamibacterales bacterium]|nr:GDP-mannose 4,6-dehydratase [Vicinamibacterales bacterium]